MTKKTINTIICIMVLFIAFFFAGSHAYNDYKIRLSDEQTQSQLDKDLANKESESSSGLVNDELANN